MTLPSLLPHLAVAIAPDRCDTLIGAEAVGRIERVAAQLPAGLTSFWGFECRLSNDAPRVDFLVCVRDAGERERLASLGEAPGNAASAFRDDSWARARAFAASWGDAASPLHRTVQNVWLEFDMEERSVPFPPPSIFFGTDAVRADDEDDSRASGAGARLVDALHCLRGARPDAALVAALERCVGALPRGAGVFQVGVMARPGNLVRLCVCGVPRGAALDFLRSAGRCGAEPRLAAVLDDAYARSAEVALDLDVTASGVASRIGIECTLGGATRETFVQPAFLAFLVERGLCSPEKAAALASFSKAVHDRRPPAAWPADLVERAATRTDGAASMFFRWLYHVKLVFSPDAALTAKAYLAVRHSFVTAQQVCAMRAIQEGM